jgi:hypothetical protein
VLPSRFCIAGYRHAQLWSLIALVGWSGCGMGYGTSEYEQWRNKKENFADLVKQMGGTAEEKYFNMFGQQGMAWIIDLSGAKYTPEQFEEFMESLPAMGYIAGMNFSGTPITDEHLRRIGEGKFGRTCMNLDLSNTAITDAGIDGMTNFNCLNTVNLKGTSVTKAAADRLKKRQFDNKEVPIPFKKPTVEL